MAAACYCVWQDKILLLKRNPNRPLGTTWGVPGGKLEEGESPSQAAVREAYEEVGIIINEDDLQKLPKIYVRRNGADVILHRYLITFPSQPLVSLNLDEHSDMQWATIPEALALPNVTGAVMGLKFL
jgi:8-oxo-dGTP pyrophosphatase MutT (NUDIX family)